MRSDWMYLFVAGFFEMAWAIALKYSHGFSRPVPSVLTILALVASLWLLALASRTLPIGTAYAVWVGVGAFGAAVLGVVLFGEPITFVRVMCLALLLLAILGLKLTATS